MKSTAMRLLVCMAAVLITAQTALAELVDFNVTEVGQYVQDTLPEWIFQILSGILLAFAQLLLPLLGITTST